MTYKVDELVTWLDSDGPAPSLCVQGGREARKGKKGDLFTRIAPYFIIISLFSSAFCVVFRVYFLCVRVLVCTCVCLCVFMMAV